MKEKLDDIKYDWEEATGSGKVLMFLKYFFLVAFVIILIVALVGVVLSGNAGAMLGSLFSSDSGNGLFSAGALVRFLIGAGILGILFLIMWLMSKK